MPAAPAMVGLDWGTTHFRARLIGADGAVLAVREAPDGLMRARESGFEAVLDREIAPWEAAHPGIPLLASGMVTSRQGWVETPYVPCPAPLFELARRLTRFDTGRRTIHFVGGLSVGANGLQPDVIRGEEVEILGAAGEAPATVVLPGTHSKWADVAGGTVVGFRTFLTGDLFAALKEQSILRLFMAESRDDPEAFARGARLGLDGNGAGLIGKLFSARTLGLFGAVEPAGLADYLSGLLIGTEIAEAQAAGLASRPVLLVGGAALTRRYEAAMALAGLASTVYAANAAPRGQWLIARAAGLLGGDAGTR